MANALDVSTDYLMNGTTSDLAAENIQDKTLINQFNRITELSKENKIVVSKLIDAFLFQQEMKVKLGQLKNRSDCCGFLSYSLLPYFLSYHSCHCFNASFVNPGYPNLFPIVPGSMSVLSAIKFTDD